MNPETTAQQPLTDQQLQDIQARANAATKGPWGIYESGSLIDIAADLQETGCGYRARREIARLEDEPLDNDPAHRDWTAEQDWAQVQADAQFIARARQDTPALLAEVRRLRIFADVTDRRHEEIRAMFAKVDIRDSAEAWDLGMAVLAILDSPPEPRAETQS